jgi:hypothetical protein
MKLIGIYLSERQLEYLKKEKEEKDISVSETIRRILDSYCFGEPINKTKSNNENS